MRQAHRTEGAREISLSRTGRGGRTAGNAVSNEAVVRGADLAQAPGSVAAPKADPKEASEKGPDFQAKRAEITEKYKLAADPTNVDWGGALKEWSDFAKGKVPADTKSRADGEMRALQGKAKDDADRLRKKA